MADVFADLVAMARIDTANFDRQLATIKSQLSGFSAASLGNITLQNLEAELVNIKKELDKLKSKSSTSSSGVQKNLDSITTNKAREEIDKFTKKLTDFEKNTILQMVEVDLDDDKAVGKIKDQINAMESNPYFNSSIKSTEKFKGAVDALNGEIEANSKAYEKASGNVLDFGKKGEKAAKEVEVGFSGIVGKALKAVAVMGTIELALGSVNSIAKLANGELEAGVEGLKQLPAGIGPVVRQLEDSLNLLTGLKTETEAIKATTDQIANNLKEANALKFATNASELNNELKLLELQAQIQREKLAGDQDALDLLNANVAAGTRLLQLELDIQAAKENKVAVDEEEFALINERAEKIEAINKKIKRARQTFTFDGTISGYEKQIKSLEKANELSKERIRLAGLEIKFAEDRESIIDELNVIEDERTNKDITNRESERIKKAIEERTKGMMEIQDLMSKAREESIKADKKAAEDKLKREVDIAQRIAKLQLDIQQKTLRAQGKNLEADLAGIQNKIREDLLGTLRIGGLQEAQLLFKNFRLDAAALREASKTEPQRLDLRSNFENTLAKLSGSDRDAKIARDREKAERRAEKQLNILDKIRELSKGQKEALEKIDFDPRWQ